MASDPLGYFSNPTRPRAIERDPYEDILSRYGAGSTLPGPDNTPSQATPPAPTGPDPYQDILDRYSAPAVEAPTPVEASTGFLPTLRHGYEKAMEYVGKPKEAIDTLAGMLTDEGGFDVDSTRGNESGQLALKSAMDPLGFAGSVANRFLGTDLPSLESAAARRAAALEDARTESPAIAQAVGDVAIPFVEQAGETLGGFVTDPTNILIPSSRAIAAGFVPGMAMGAYDAAQRAYEAGFTPEGARAAAEALTQGTMGALTAGHVLSRGGPRAIERAVDEAPAPAPIPEEVPFAPVNEPFPVPEGRAIEFGEPNVTAFNYEEAAPIPRGTIFEGEAPPQPVFRPETPPVDVLAEREFLRPDLEAQVGAEQARLGREYLAERRAPIPTEIIESAIAPEGPPRLVPTELQRRDAVEVGTITPKLGTIPDAELAARERTYRRMGLQEAGDLVREEMAKRAETPDPEQPAPAQEAIPEPVEARPVPEEIVAPRATEPIPAEIPESNVGLRPEPLTAPELVREPELTRGPERRQEAAPVAEDRRLAQRRTVAQEIGLPEDHPAVERVLAAEEARAASDLRADTDAQTGVVGRDAYARLAKDIQNGKAPPPAAVSEVDVAGAGATNQQFGERFTDARLVATGEALKAIVGDAGTVFRKGGDEFVVHWKDGPSGENLHKGLAKSLNEAHVVVRGADGKPEAAWTGVEHYAGFGPTFDEASAAVYRAKPKQGEPGYKAVPAGLPEKIAAGRTDRGSVPPGEPGVRGGEPVGEVLPTGERPGAGPRELAEPPAEPPKFAAGEAKPLPGITKDQIRKAFAAGAVEERAPGHWEVGLPGNRRVQVRIAPDGIEYNPSAFKAGYSREKGAGEQIVGSWQRVGRDGVVWLAKEADQGTVHHEAFHGAMDLALSDKERSAVLKKYGNEEAAAEAYAKWTPATTNSWFSKILQTFKRLYRSFRPNWESAFERTRSGEAFGKAGEAGEVGPKYAAFPKRTADTMSDAIAMSSPSGRMSGRANKAATARLGEALFGKGATREDFTGPVAQPSKVESLRQQATRLRELADRGMSTKKFNREAARLEAEAAALESAPTEPKYATAPSQPPTMRKGFTAPEEQFEIKSGREFKVGSTSPGGRPPKPGEAPQVEKRVETLKATEKAIGAEESTLAREAPRTWESLDPKIQKILRDTPEETLLKRAAKGDLDDAGVQAMASVVKGKQEIMARAREALSNAKEGLEDSGEANAKYLSSALDYIAAERAHVQGGTETARALAARARVMDAGATVPHRFLKQVFKEIEGVTDAQAAELLRVFQEEPARLPEALRAAIKPGIWDKFFEYWRAGLVSAPGTQFANVFGNFLEQTARLGETAVGSMLDRIVPGERVRLGSESRAEVYGASTQVKEASSRLWRDVKDAFTLAPESFDVRRGRFEQQVGAIGGKTGKAVRIPFRLLQSADNWFKAVGGGAELGKLSHREAFRELGANARPDAIARRSQEIALNPPKELLAQIEAAKQKRTFQEDPGSIAKFLMQARKSQPWLNLVVPFINTPANIARRVIERSPLGFAFKEAREAPFAFKRAEQAFKAGRMSRDAYHAARNKAIDALARPILGTAMLGAFSALAQSGVMTGSGPSDPRKRNLLKDTGWSPYSFKITLPGQDPFYVPYNRFEPVSSMLGFAADMIEAKDAKKSGDMLDKLVGSLMSNLTSKTYLSGIADFAEFWNDPSGRAGRYASGIVGSLVPNVVAKVAQAADPTLRSTIPESAGIAGAPERIAKTVQSRIPGVSRALPPVRSATGEEVKRPGSAFTRLVSPVQPTTQKRGKELEEFLVDIDYVPGAPSRDFTIPGSRGKTIRLDNEEYATLQDADKRAADYVRRNYLDNSRFRALGPEQQRQLVERVYSRARSSARQRLYGQSTFRRKAQESVAR